MLLVNFLLLLYQIVMYYYYKTITFFILIDCIMLIWDSPTSGFFVTCCIFDCSFNVTEDSHLPPYVLKMSLELRSLTYMVCATAWACWRKPIFQGRVPWNGRILTPCTNIKELAILGRSHFHISYSLLWEANYWTKNYRTPVDWLCLIMKV